MFSKEEITAIKPKTLDERISSRIAIHVPGFIVRGYWSPGRGESRWAQNLAKISSESGYNVMAVNELNGWTDCLRVGGMYPASWFNFDSQTEFDMMLDTAWHDRSAAINQKIKAKIYVMGFWGYDHNVKGDECLVAKNKNYWYAYPIWSLYSDDEKNQEMTNSNKKLFFPIPLYRDLPSESNFKKREFLWAIKEFWRDDRISRIRRILKGMKMMADAHPEIFFNFFMTKEFQHLKVPNDIRDLLNSIPHKEKYDELIGYNLVQDALSRTKVLITNGDPPTGPITLECVAKGGVPMLWGKNHHWGDNGVTDIPEDADEEEIFNTLDQLYTDEGYYNHVWERLKKKLWCHQQDTALAIFEHQMNYALENSK